MKTIIRLALILLAVYIGFKMIVQKKSLGDIQAELYACIEPIIQKFKKQ